MYDPMMRTVAESIQSDHRAEVQRARQCADARGVPHAHTRAQVARTRRVVAHLLIALAHGLAPPSASDYPTSVASS